MLTGERQSVMPAVDAKIRAKIKEPEAAPHRFSPSIFFRELAGLAGLTQLSSSFPASAINAATSEHNSAMVDSSTSRNPSYSARFRFWWALSRMRH